MNMNREDLKAFADGELPQARSLDLRTWIESDGEAAEQLALLKLIGEGIRDVASDPPVSGATELLNRFAERRPLRWPILAFAGVVGCLAVAVFAPVLLSGAGTRTFAKHMVASGTAASAPMTSLPAAVNGVRMRTTLGGAKSLPGGSRDQAGTADATVVAENGRELSPAAPPAGGRMVVQTAELDEIVHDVSSAESSVRATVKLLGGYVGSSALQSAPGQAVQASLTVRIPVARFTAALDRFKSLAVDARHIKSFGVTGQDVTAQYGDSVARERVLVAEEDSYVTMLRAAKTLGQTLAIKDRLSAVRQQIESYKAQAETLKNTSDTSEVDLTLEQEPPHNLESPIVRNQNTAWYTQAWISASTGLSDSLHLLGVIAIFLFVYSPIWVPLALVGFWLYRRYW